MYGNRGSGGGGGRSRDRDSGYGGGGGGYGGGGGGYGGGSYDRGPSTAPVKVGDEFETTIEAVGEKGDGIAKKDGFVLFVPGVKQGQKVRIRVTKVLRKVGFAEVVGAAGAAAPAAESSDDGGEAPAEEAAPAEAAEESSTDSESFGEEGSEE